MKYVLILLALALSACTNETSAKRVLEANGFTKIEFTGYRFFMCGHDDWFHTGFKAMHYAQQPITGAVCEGLIFKGSTLRFD